MELDGEVKELEAQLEAKRGALKEVMAETFMLARARASHPMFSLLDRCEATYEETATSVLFVSGGFRLVVVPVFGFRASWA